MVSRHTQPHSIFVCCCQKSHNIFVFFGAHSHTRANHIGTVMSMHAHACDTRRNGTRVILVQASKRSQPIPLPAVRKEICFCRSASSTMRVTFEGGGGKRKTQPFVYSRSQIIRLISVTTTHCTGRPRVLHHCPSELRRGHRRDFAALRRRYFATPKRQWRRRRRWRLQRQQRRWYDIDATRTDRAAAATQSAHHHSADACQVEYRNVPAGGINLHVE